MITHEMIVLVLSGLVGLLIHYLTKWNDAKETKKRFTLKGKLPSILIVVVGLCCIAFLGEEIHDFFVPTKISMMILGYAGHSAILKLFNKKVE